MGPRNLVADAIRTRPITEPEIPMGSRNLVADAKSYFKFAEFTLTVEDAKKYVYSLSTKRRVYN